MSSTPLLAHVLADDDALHAFESLFASHRINRWCHFRDADLEAAYRSWHQRVYKWDTLMGLLISNFLFVVVAIVYATWSHEFSDPLYTRLLLLCDSLMGVTLTICFGLAFHSCAECRPYLISSAALLLTSFFVVIRAYLLINFAAVSPVVLVILIVCILLGSTLMRMPFAVTFGVGCVLLVIYGMLALLELQQAAEGSGWYAAALFGVTASASIGARQLELAQRRLFLMQSRLSLLLGDDVLPPTSSTRHHSTPTRTPPGMHASRTRAVDPLIPRSATGLADAAVSRPNYGEVEYSRSPLSSRDADLLDALLSAGVSAAASPRMDRVGFDAAKMRHGGFGGTPTALRLANRASSAPSALGETDGAVGEALSDMFSELAGALQGNTRLSSIEAVHHALNQSSNSSLRDYMASALLERLGALHHALLDRLPLPPWLMPGSSVDDAALERAPARPREEFRETFVLVTSEELPPWFTPYAYVSTGYRCHFSYPLMIRSLFRLHNETVNVWTELGPAIVFAVWSLAFLERHRDAPQFDRLLVALGLATATVVRPLCSSLAHLLHCSSPGRYIFWWSLDYCSICLASAPRETRTDAPTRLRTSNDASPLTSHRAG